MYSDRRINRNIVECKAYKYIIVKYVINVLIETLWNVKREKYLI